MICPFRGYAPTSYRFVSRNDPRFMRKSAAEVIFLKRNPLDFYCHLAKSLAAQFGPDCEIVVHDLKNTDLEHSIIAIENGHVTGRSVGDGPSQIVLEALQQSHSRTLEDRPAYLTRTKDGKVLRSSTIYIRNESDEVIGILGINYDITTLISVETTLRNLTFQDASAGEPQPISPNVNDLLDGLIDQSVRLVGKPPALMSREEKIRAIRFLNDSGAFLITKSGPKVCDYFGISKFTLYSYLEEVRSDQAEP